MLAPMNKNNKMNITFKNIALWVHIWNTVIRNAIKFSDILGISSLSQIKGPVLIS